MPAALNVDKEAVKMLVQDVGVRAAADMLGLPYQTVGAWSARYKWIQSIARNQPLPASMVQTPKNGASNGANSPSVVRENAIREKLIETRLNHAQVALDASKDLLKKKPADLTTAKGSVALLNVGKHAALVGGWEGQTNVVKMNLGLTGQSSPTIEAEIVTQDAGAEELP